MRKKREVVAIIPARGGSKGIPRKNIADLCGKPLVAYSILAAKNAELVDRVIVSTEDEEIAEVSRKWGAEVPFLRPKRLAGDFIGVENAISYTIKNIDVNPLDIVTVQLYPTSPFRTPKFIDEMINILLSGFTSVSTVKKITIDLQNLFLIEGDEIKRLTGNEDVIPVWKKYYRTYPLFLGQMMTEHERHYYHPLTNKCMLVDVDSLSDLRWAEKIIENNQFDFGF